MNWHACSINDNTSQAAVFWKTMSELPNFTRQPPARHSFSLQTNGLDGLFIDPRLDDSNMSLLSAFVPGSLFALRNNC